MGLRGFEAEYIEYGCSEIIFGFLESGRDEEE
jgi:hypothetical protein